MRGIRGSVVFWLRVGRCHPYGVRMHYSRSELESLHPYGVNAGDASSMMFLNVSPQPVHCDAWFAFLIHLS